MAITNASRLADFGSGIGTAGAVIQIDNANQRVGIGTNAPSTTLQVAGIVSATSFSGNLTGTATTSFGLSGTPNITVGVVTATSAVVGSAVTINSSGVNVTGIVTATSFVGSGSKLTGLSASFNELDAALFS